jgi:hypothetical protein
MEKNYYYLEIGAQHLLHPVRLEYREVPGGNYHVELQLNTEQMPQRVKMRPLPPTLPTACIAPNALSRYDPL